MGSQQIVKSIPDRIGKAERDKLAEHPLAVAAEADAVEEVFLTRHHVSDFERAHDLPESLGRHVLNVAEFEIELDVQNKLVRSANLGEDLAVAVFADEVVPEVYNVLSHFYLLSRDFPSPVWIAIPRYSVSCDMSQRKTH